ncbi:MAG: uracil-DNA glycosylase family protein [Candidatus Symbiothrix sp.]|jgi:G:T/U-mismatch repair DNA glycosylase|nr:uracil-DNA glycosylase family protein [Candidatus Symbiothrix sp.]
MTSEEIHPLQPFLPEEAKLLMLGSFPPQKKRWVMDFYYPNFNNDMWRIMGIIFFNDKNYFLNEAQKAFCRESIINFLIQKKIALFDTATIIRRLNDNASDKFLEIVKSTNIKDLLNRIPHCTTIVTTGQKATDILIRQFDIEEPKMGESIAFFHDQRSMRFYRMPSSSRAYPLKLESKAGIYRKMFEAISI